jgi:hypothetical protein
MEYQKSKESFKIRSWQINFVRKLRAVEFGKCNVCRNKSKILFEHDFTGLILALGVVHEGPRRKIVSVLKTIYKKVTDVNLH